MLQQQNFYHFYKYCYVPKHFTCNFYFISLIAPFILNNIKPFFFGSRFSTKKLLLKNSYIILTWFYYLTIIESSKTTLSIKFFVLPTRTKVYTLTKAPIAHKLWSKEQYKFVFYTLKISFLNHIFVDSLLVNLNQALLFIFICKKNLPHFATNLLILKKIQFTIESPDRIFFTY